MIQNYWLINKLLSIIYRWGGDLLILIYVVSIYTPSDGTKFTSHQIFTLFHLINLFSIGCLTPNTD